VPCRLLHQHGEGLPQQPGGVECGGYMLSFAETIINTNDVRQARNASIAKTGYDGMRSDMYQRIKVALTSTAQAAAGKVQ
jgi:hypothetical protein